MFDFKDFVSNKRLEENLKNDLLNHLDKILVKADEVIETLSERRQ